MRNASEVAFTSLQPEHASQVAILHKEGIPTGFLSSLGPEFLEELYRSISQSPEGFGFVVSVDNQIAGFVAFCSNLRSLYKDILRGKTLKFLWVLTPKLISWKVLKKVIENIIYPGKTEKLNLPSAELLSIVVLANHQGKGFARKLIEMGFQECSRRNITHVKVLVAESNLLANRLYQKTGFQFITKIENHGVVSNVYVVPTDYFKENPLC